MITQQLLDSLKVGQKVKINNSGVWINCEVMSILDWVTFVELNNPKEQHYALVSEMLEGCSFVKEIVINDFYVGQKLTVTFNTSRNLVVEVTDNLVFIRDPDSEDARIFTYEKTWLKSRTKEFGGNGCHRTYIARDCRQV